MFTVAIAAVVVYFFCRAVAGFLEKRGHLKGALPFLGVLFFLIGLFSYRAFLNPPAEPALDGVNTPGVQRVSSANRGTAASAPLRTHADSNAPRLNLPILQASDDYIGSIDILSLSPTDRSNSDVAFPVGSKVYASGWVAERNDKKPVARGFAIVVDSRLVYDRSADYGVSRPDLVKGFNDPNLMRAGFLSAEVPTSGLAKGPHTIGLAAGRGDGKYYLISKTVKTIKLI